MKLTKQIENMTEHYVMDVAYFHDGRTFIKDGAEIVIEVPTHGPLNLYDRVGCSSMSVFQVPS